MKKLKKVIIIVVVLTALLLLAAYIYLRHTLPKTAGTIRLKGIRQEVLIKRNGWGVPLIEAGSIEDMFFAVGFVHAQDRLLQMDLTRRFAAGRLSEVFGPRTLDIDRQQRELLIEESIGKSLENVNPEIDKILNSYCRGVNACMESQPLPPEFLVLGYRPEAWQPADILGIFKTMETMLASSGSELYNFKVVQALGPGQAARLLPGVWGSTIIGTQEYNDWHRRSASGLPGGRLFTHPALKTALLNEMSLMENSIGSNNWVISGQRTKSGAPILANDPHLALVFPSYFYQVAARAPGLELCGNSLPGVPVIVIGRNQHIGWGFTNIGTDVTDYFFLTINPENPDQYQWDGQWRDFEIIEKRIKVKGENDHIQRIKVCPLGPVMQEDGLVLARHSVVQYPSTVMDAFYRMNLAANTAEFIAGLKKFSSPAQNAVFADTRGNIGYFPTGLIPRRSRGDGSLPTAAGGEADGWNGFYPEDEKPFLLNPGKGYIVTANNPVLPEGRLPIFAVSWSPSFRADRIAELIATKATISIADNRAIQTDSFLKAAQFLVQKIKDFKYNSREADFVLERLKNWDYRTEKGIAPFLFHRFERRLADNIFGDHFKEKKLKGLVSRNWLYKIMDYPQKEIENSADFSAWVDDLSTARREDFREIVEKSLVETYDEYNARAQEQDLDWQQLHTLTYRPRPLGAVFPFKLLLVRGPYTMPGGRGCILTASFRGEGFAISHLSTFRMILDFSDFSNSLLINSTGQSGHFLSRHYDDQIPLYTGLRYRKMEDFPGKPKTLRLIPLGE